MDKGSVLVPCQHLNPCTLACRLLSLSVTFLLGRGKSLKRLCIHREVDFQSFAPVSSCLTLSIATVEHVCTLTHLLFLRVLSVNVKVEQYLIPIGQHWLGHFAAALSSIIHTHISIIHTHVSMCVSTATCYSALRALSLSTDCGF